LSAALNQTRETTPMKTIPLHTEHTLSFPTNETHSAHAYGNIGVHIVATVSLIAFAEETSGQLLFPFLDTSEISVGSLVSIKHKAPAPIGSTIVVHSRLIEQRENKMMFSIQAFHNQRLLLEGTHGRVILNRIQMPSQSAEEK